MYCQVKWKIKKKKQKTKLKRPTSGQGRLSERLIFSIVQSILSFKKPRSVTEDHEPATHTEECVKV